MMMKEILSRCQRLKLVQSHRFQDKDHKLQDQDWDLDQDQRQTSKGQGSAARFGVGLVIERSLVRLPAGVISSQGQLSLPSFWGR